MQTKFSAHMWYNFSLTLDKTDVRLNIKYFIDFALSANLKYFRLRTCIVFFIISIQIHCEFACKYFMSFLARIIAKNYPLCLYMRYSVPHFWSHSTLKPLPLKFVIHHASQKRLTFIKFSTLLIIYRSAKYALVIIFGTNKQSTITTFLFKKISLLRAR